MSVPSGVSRYDIGDLVQLRATVVGTDGITPINPSYFAFIVKSPAGSVASYLAFGPSAAAASVVNPSTGAFFRDITVDYDGAWFYRTVATGLAQAAEEWTFLVDRSSVI